MLKMAACNDLLHLVLWAVAVMGTGRGCPELCVCSDENGRHLAMCNYKDLADVPGDLPSNVTILNLSRNKIAFVGAGSFDGITGVASLWIAHNRIVSVEEGSLAPLVRLRNFDVSHNQLVDFPWGDLRNLTALQMLKMNHNEMVALPRDAFANLRDLNSLRLNNNRFLAVAQGTFDGLLSISHLQLYNNPFTCDCFLDWLRVWILNAGATVPERHLIVCANPRQFKGRALVKLPPSKCSGPNVTITAQPNIDPMHVHEDASLTLTCEFRGNPRPAIMWHIRSQSHRETVAVTPGDDGSADSAEDPSSADGPFQVFGNGTLVMYRVGATDSGNYSCAATNEFGTAEDVVAVEVTKKWTRTYVSVTRTRPALRRESVTPVSELPPLADEAPSPPSPPPPSSAPPPDVSTENRKRAPQRNSTHATKCGLTSNTKYVSNHGFNGSLEDVKEYTFDFGVIALSVAESEARVRLNPLLVAGDKTGAGHAARGRARSEGLYLCVSSEREDPAVQWSAIQQGVNTYVFRDLRPATNYSLCFTYTGQDCDVQVLFTTRRGAPSLLVIISVCIVLLTVSTVPLLAATCYHLVYKYRGKTYKLILKARDQYQVERNLGGHFHLHAPYPSDSRRNINAGELEEEEEEEEEGDGEMGEDEEGSMATESFSMSRANTEDCEAGSEYSDRLPLGAEAVNITSNYKYPGH